MPCLSIPYNPRIGPLIQLAIWPPGYAPPSAMVPGTAPLQVSLYTALIDTGASNTCISAKVIADLGLSPSGKVAVGGVHGSQATNGYQFQVAIVFIQGPPSATGAVLTNAHVTPVSGVEFIPSGAFDVLLGRDVICMGSFTMTFDGHATLCL